MAGNPAVFLGSMADALAAAAAHNYPGGPSLAVLFSPADIERLAAGHTDLGFCAFKWCIGCISLANHRGDIQGAEPWRTPAERLLERVRDDDKLEYLNHRLVGERFNRYDFRPEIPADIVALLEIEERRQAISPRDNRNLGAIYGTIAQNFGFCGPAYLAELRRYAGLASAAFGNRHQVETLRSRAYLLYGLLDAGLFDEAAAELNAYLGIQEGSGLNAAMANLAHLLHTDPDRNAYQAAVTCRVLADIGRDGITDGSLGHLALVAGKTVQRKQHPWQLTALNLGRLYRLLGDEKAAERLLQHALDICLAGETTMRAMALLPLAELHRMGAAGEWDYALAREIGQLLREGVDLNSAHFQMLFREPAQPDPRTMLAAVYDLRHTLFPFSYR
jgi:tetratricopeptide (TPR) repeat protein